MPSAITRDPDALMAHGPAALPKRKAATPDATDGAARRWGPAARRGPFRPAPRVPVRTRIDGSTLAQAGDIESAKLVEQYAHRHRTKHGVTGWTAIKGSRGPIDTPKLVRERIALSTRHIERQTFWLGLYIIVMTLPCLLWDRSVLR